MGKGVHMTHKLSGLGVFVFLAKVVFATNTPTFFYPLTNAGINAVATDSAGNTYLTGTTTGGASLVTTPGAFQTQFTATGQCMDSIGSLPCDDSFIVKLDPTGAVVFATYLGGNGHTSAYTIAVDQQGNVYVAGTTSPPYNAANTFPVTPGAAFTDPATIPGFIAKLNPSGTQLVYSTFIPGVQPASLAIDSGGSAYITGAGVNSDHSGRVPVVAEIGQQFLPRRRRQAERIRFGAGLRHLSFGKRAARQQRRW